jgi:hypothetical protein
MAENAACGSDVSSFPGDAICRVCSHPAHEHAKWKVVSGRGDRQTVVKRERANTVREPEFMPNASGRARKGDAGKPRWSLLFGAFRGPLEEIIAVREYGIVKYGGDISLQDVPNGEERYKEALARHVIAYLGGEDLDSGPEGSGLPHLAHAGINVLFLLWYRARRLAQSSGEQSGR